MLYPPWGKPPSRARGRGRGMAPRGRGTYRNVTWVASANQPSTDSAAIAEPVVTPKKTVVIDGVTFIADPKGHKLVRLSGSKPSDLTAESTPKKTVITGTQYVRTKAGNLVSAEYAAKKRAADKTYSSIAKAPRSKGRPTKRKSTQLCRFFQRTGKCSQALTCQFVHDSDKVSICVPSLRTPSACSHSASTCPLSHVRLPQRVPHCLHFPDCTNSHCPYVHVQVASDAPLCEAFATFGWCELGEKCSSRHRMECFSFWKDGICKRKGCKESHVFRRKAGAEDEKTSFRESAQDDVPKPASTSKPTRPPKRLREWEGISMSSKRNKEENNEDDGFLAFEDSADEDSISEAEDDLSDSDIESIAENNELL